MYSKKYAEDKRDIALSSALYLVLGTAALYSMHAHVRFLAGHFCLDRLDGDNEFFSRDCASRRALSRVPLHHSLLEGMYGRSTPCLLA